ncbi:Rossmann-fold NAD(P)-binding domain-containing protein [Thermocatellispora tengchongensis]|uniref:hypothetical protein n=1 Tax=Thermocatellispora tengchongensis TaxID=1073253 RepID=UPI0036251DE6
MRASGASSCCPRGPPGSSCGTGASSGGSVWPRRRSRSPVWSGPTCARPGSCSTRSGGRRRSAPERSLREPFADIGYPLLHEDDLADVAAAALLDDGHHGRAYPLTGPEPVSPADQARLIGAAIGREVPFEELTPQQARDRWIALGRPADEVDLELFVMSEYAGRSIPADPTLEHVLGRPGRTYAQWAAEHAADFIPGGAS